MVGGVAHARYLLLEGVHGRNTENCVPSLILQLVYGSNDQWEYENIIMYMFYGLQL